MILVEHLDYPEKFKLRKWAAVRQTYSPHSPSAVVDDAGRRKTSDGILQLARQHRMDHGAEWQE
eukprot:12354874-Prorocentrum_lima.AAC.1